MENSKHQSLVSMNIHGK